MSLIQFLHLSTWKTQTPPKATSFNGVALYCVGPLSFCYFDKHVKGNSIMLMHVSGKQTLECEQVLNQQ